MSQQHPLGDVVSGLAPPAAEVVDWYAHEPGLGEAAHEVQRVVRRARSRPITTLFLAIFVTLLVVGMAAKKGRLHRARVILRLQEQALAGEAGFMAKGDLRNHVAHVIFSQERLLALMEQLGLYEGERQLGDDVALTEMRDGLDVNVFRNYFLVGRGDHGERQERMSVRIAVSFTHPDYAIVTPVAEALAALVIEFEAARRQASITAAVQVINRAVTVAKARVEACDQELASKSYLLGEATGVDRTRLQLEVGHLTSTLRAYQAMLDEAVGSAEAAALAAGAEARNLAVNIEVAQVLRPPPPPESRKKLLTMIAVITFIFALPLCAIAVGAFDSRVYELEDVERIGMAGLGHVPGFSGSNEGSLAQRIGARPWWRRLFSRP